MRTKHPARTITDHNRIQGSLILKEKHHEDPWIKSFTGKTCTIERASTLEKFL